MTDSIRSRVVPGIDFSTADFYVNHPHAAFARWRFKVGAAVFRMTNIAQGSGYYDFRQPVGSNFRDPAQIDRFVKNLTRLQDSRSKFRSTWRNRPRGEHSYALRDVTRSVILLLSLSIGEKARSKFSQLLRYHLKQSAIILAGRADKKLLQRMQRTPRVSF